MNRTAADGGIPRKMAEFRKKNPAIPAEKTPSFPPQKPRNSRRKQEKTPVIPAKAGIHFEEQNCEFTSFFHKKMRGNSKINRPEWIPAFAGMTAGRAGIRRRKSDGGGRRNSTKKRRERGIYRRKWIPAFAGMTAGRAGIRRRKSDGGGRRNSTKKRREHGNLSAKMDSRFRGNDGGEGGNSAAKIGRRRAAEFHKKTA